LVNLNLWTKIDELQICKTRLNIQHAKTATKQTRLGGLTNTTGPAALLCRHWVALQNTSPITGKHRKDMLSTIPTYGSWWSYIPFPKRAIIHVTPLFLTEDEMHGLWWPAVTLALQQGEQFYLAGFWLHASNGQLGFIECHLIISFGRTPNFGWRNCSCSYSLATIRPFSCTSHFWTPTRQKLILLTLSLDGKLFVIWETQAVLNAELISARYSLKILTESNSLDSICIANWAEMLGKTRFYCFNLPIFINHKVQEQMRRAQATQRYP